MEVKKGYKLTEAGLVPEDWNIKKLEAIGVFSKGSGIKKDEVLSEGIPCIRYGEIYTTHHDYIRHFRSFISVEVANQSRKLKKGDLLFAGSGETADEIGKCVAFLGDEIAYAGGDIVILSQSGEDALFLGYLLNSPAIARQKASRGQGDAVVHISAKNLSNISIPLPPTLTEQRAIATALSDVDRLLSAYDQLIAKKKAIKQGAMQELLTGKRRLEGFEGEWVWKTFDECFEFLNTGSNSRSELSDNEEVKYIHYGDIHSKWLLVLDCSNSIIPTIKEDKVTGLPFLKDGDLVIADASEDYSGVGVSIEIINIKDSKVVAGLHTILLRSKNDLVADGFKAYLTSKPEVKSALIRIATGISVYGISKSQLKLVEIQLPPTVDEQRAIAQILTDMDAEITALEQQRDKYKAVKQGMMQELLTGKTRLV